MSRPTPLTYETTNWPADNEALKCRCSLTIWFDPEMSRDATPTGRRGRQQTYSDTAIQACLTMKGEGRPGNAPVARFSPERAEPRASSAWSTLLRHWSERQCRPGRRLGSSRACCGWLASTGRCPTSARCPAVRRPWPSTSPTVGRRARCTCSSTARASSTGIKHGHQGRGRRVRRDRGRGAAA